MLKIFLEDDSQKPTTSRAAYDVLVNKNDENDPFDEQVLLQRVPENHRNNAKKLLKVFDSHPEDITWNTSGILFIDDVAIPNSDIKLIFPKLFEKTDDLNFNVKGLEELVFKIQLMGYGNLISRKHAPIVNLDDLSSDDSESTPWYYIGL